MKKLTKNAVELIKNKRTSMLIALDIDISIWTLKKWVKDQDDKLTKLKCISAIKKHTGLKEDEIFEDENKNQAS